MSFKIILVCIISASLADSHRMGTLKPKEDTLQLVHVLFRHGERTPDAATIYPKDPYANETYFPFGLGALTNEGKRTQYNLGRALRARYNKFIGSVYQPDFFDVHSSPVRRTKISAQLVMASLFTPSNAERWNDYLNWQPVDFDFESRERDLLFLYTDNCPKFQEALAERYVEVVRNGEIEDFEKLAMYLTHHTGWNVTSPYEMFLVYACLVSESEWGFELPKWTEQVYPEPLTSIAARFWQFSTDRETLKTLSGGFLMKKIAEDTQNKINGTASFKDKRMVLYSGHDFTVTALLNALGVFEPHNPTYGAYILIEVHKIRGVHGVKVFYQDYSSKFPRLLQLPQCGDFCPFAQFLELYKQYFPTRDMCHKKS